jgi:hypothetical protein
LAEQTGANAHCPRCGAAFHCGAREARCECAQVALDADTLARLRADYGAQCLCGACLRALLSEAEPDPATAPEIRIDDLRGPEIRALLEEPQGPVDRSGAAADAHRRGGRLERRLHALTDAVARLADVLQAGRGEQRRCLQRQDQGQRPMLQCRFSILLVDR